MNIQEIAGAINFWVEANGTAHRLEESHVTWAAKKFNFHLPDDRDDPTYWTAQGRVYEYMFSQRWMRTSIDFVPRYMYVDHMATSRHKLWVAEESRRYHLLAQDTSGHTICDFRAEQPKESLAVVARRMLVRADGALAYANRLTETVDPRDWLLDQPSLSFFWMANGHSLTVFINDQNVPNWMSGPSKNWPRGIGIIDQDGSKWRIARGSYSKPALPPETLALRFDTREEAAHELWKFSKDPAVSEAVDPREFILARDTPASDKFRFVASSYMGEQVWVNTKRREFWPQPIGCINPDPAGKWWITFGKFDGKRWLWWEHATDQIRSLRFDTREEAAMKLWSLMKDKKVHEAVNPRDWLLSQPAPIQKGQKVYVVWYPHDGQGHEGEMTCSPRFDTLDRALIWAIKNRNYLPQPVTIRAYSDTGQVISTYSVTPNRGLRVIEAVLPSVAFALDGRCPICESADCSTNACASCGSRWNPDFSLVESALPNPRDFIMSNPGSLQYTMKAGLEDRTHYEYDFTTFGAAYRAAQHKMQNFSVTIEAWDIPEGNELARMVGHWYVNQDGEVKEIPLEQKRPPCEP